MKTWLRELRDILVSIAFIVAAVCGVMFWTETFGCGGDDPKETTRIEAQKLGQVERQLESMMQEVCLRGQLFYCLSIEKDRIACLPFAHVFDFEGKPVSCRR